MSPYRVGLTGGIGSGKTTVANLFADLGITVVDTDLIAHQLTSPHGEAMPAITAEFGASYVDRHGALDRVAMRQLVFSQPLMRLRLEAVLHPMIACKTMQACAEATSAYVIVAVPLLLEAEGWKERFNRILVVDCEETLQIRRVMARSGISADEARRILAAQATRAERLAIADDIIQNSAGLPELSESVIELHHRYCELAKKLEAKC